MSLFDSHCHLNFKAFRDDAQAIAQHMAEEDVSGMVVGCDRHSSRDAIALAQAHPHLWASVGLHPTHVLDDPWEMPVMRQLAEDDRVMAIGEVGLDFYRFPGDPALKDQYLESQYITFQAAIDLALELDKPLIIHSRQAYDEIITVLEKNFTPYAEGPLRGTIHCYMGNWQQAQQLLKLGFMLGYTGVITYKDADPAMLEAAQQTPLDRLLIETDAPYLTPEPYRTEGRKRDGKTPRNLPQYTIEAARTLATLHHTTTEEIVRITDQNARRLFRLTTESTK